METSNVVESNTAVAPSSTSKTARKGGKRAKVKATKKVVKAAAWKKDPKRIAQLKKDIPVGSLVKYTGGRVASHEGKSGTVVGYRDANGLLVDFGKAGKGTISVPKAQVIRKGAKGKEVAAAS